MASLLLVSGPFRNQSKANVAPPKRPSALALAVARGNVTEARRLLHAGARVNGRVAPPAPEFDAFGDTPLNIALLRRDPTMVRTLLRAGANPHPLRLQFSPLLLAVQQRDAQSAELLLRAGAHPNVEACYHVTPLGVARDNRDWQITRLLRRYGAYH